MKKRLIIEIDRGQHAEQEDYDSSPTEWLEAEGFQVLRFWNHEVLQNIDEVKEVIFRHLN